jgi:hypothetical protein
VRCQRGQASLEWVGLVLLVCLACAAAVAAGAGTVDGRPFGAELARALVCAVRGGCASGDDELARAYGESDAALVRDYLPGLVYEPRTRTLPVDFRHCRSHRCSDAPDERGLDVHRSGGGTRATVFTRLVHDGGETFIQYWLYYPDSTSTWMGSAGIWNTIMGPVAKDPKSTYPGFHNDDWESVQVRVDAAGDARMRASSHHGYQGCKQSYCHNQWTPWMGWSRVSYGSHAGHIPVGGRDLEERTTTSAGVRLVPLEGLSARDRETKFEISPPWEKVVYRDPRSDSTG